MNSKASSRSNDSLSSTEDDVNDDLDSSSSSNSNRNHEVNNNNDEDEVFVDEINVFESSFLDEAFVFSTSLVVSLFNSVAARTKELKKLNVNIII